MIKKTKMALCALATLTAISGCANSLDPPVVVGEVLFPKAISPEKSAPDVSVWLLPVTYSGRDKRLGTLFHAMGSRSHLLVKKPLTQSVQEEIQDELINEGISVQMARTTDHPLSVSVSIETLDDRVTAAPLNVRQKAVVVLNYKIISHPSAGVTKTVSGTISRHQSPTPDALFHRQDPPSLIGSMLDDAIRTELVPIVLRTYKESP